MPKFRVCFDAMLLCKMSLSICVLMPAKIYIVYFICIVSLYDCWLAFQMFYIYIYIVYIYIYIYILKISFLLNDQSFHYWRKLWRSNWLKRNWFPHQICISHHRVFHIKYVSVIIIFIQLHVCNCYLLLFDSLLLY